jgi:hypothetical protein
MHLKIHTLHSTAIIVDLSENEKDKTTSIGCKSFTFGTSKCLIGIDREENYAGV